VTVVSFVETLKAMGFGLFPKTVIVELNTGKHPVEHPVLLKWFMIINCALGVEQIFS
jgi:hypothetical protein